MNSPRNRRIAQVMAAALFFVALLATLHARQSAPTQRKAPDGSAATHQDMPGMDHDMPGMDMGVGTDQQAEHGAVSAMSHMHHHQMGPHMYMTTLRPSNPQDWGKADQIAQQLREAIEKYKDYHVALADGYRIFMPKLPQAEYHFTNYQNAFVESFSFDPARPTSLLYKKNNAGYELIGAMYTMPKRVSEEQLNARIPLSVAQWHLHTKLCMPPKDQRENADWTKFGFQGSIASEGACTEAGGIYYPVIFGWMAHVYPFETSREKVWAQ